MSELKHVCAHGHDLCDKATSHCERNYPQRSKSPSPQYASSGRPDLARRALICHNRPLCPSDLQSKKGGQVEQKAVSKKSRHIQPEERQDEAAFNGLPMASCIRESVASSRPFIETQARSKSSVARLQDILHKPLQGSASGNKCRHFRRNPMKH